MIEVDAATFTFAIPAGAIGKIPPTLREKFLASGTVNGYLNSGSGNFIDYDYYFPAGAVQPGDFMLTFLMGDSPSSAYSINTNNNSAYPWTNNTYSNSDGSSVLMQRRVATTVDAAPGAYVRWQWSSYQAALHYVFMVFRPGTTFHLLYTSGGDTSSVGYPIPGRGGLYVGMVGEGGTDLTGTGTEVYKGTVGASVLRARVAKYLNSTDVETTVTPNWIFYGTTRNKALIPVIIGTAPPVGPAVEAAGLSFASHDVTVRREFPPAHFSFSTPQAIANDHLANAVVVTAGNSYPFRLLDATREVGEVDPATGPGAGSVWYKFVSPGPGYLTVQAGPPSFDGLVELLEGDSFDNMNLVDWEVRSGGSIDLNNVIMGGGMESFIRVSCRNGGDTLASGRLSVSYTPRVANMELEKYGDLHQTPDILRVNVGNGQPNAVVDFYLDGDLGEVVGSCQLNELGVLRGVPVFIPAILSGTHTLTAISGAQEFTISFIVEVDPAQLPTTPGGSTITDPAVGTTRWVMKDPAPGGLTYIFEINPATMSSVNAPKNITFAPTTAQDGQPLSWEGAPKPVEWTFGGYLESEEQYEALKYFGTLQRRFWVVDHHRRKWIVALDTVEMVPRRNNEKPWAHDYSVRAIIFGGPFS